MISFWTSRKLDSHYNTESQAVRHFVNHWNKDFSRMFSEELESVMASCAELSAEDLGIQSGKPLSSMLLENL